MGQSVSDESPSSSNNNSNTSHSNTQPNSPFISNQTSSTPKLSFLLTFITSLSLITLLSLYSSFLSTQPVYLPNSLPPEARGGGAGSCRMSYTSPSYLLLHNFSSEYTRLGGGPWGLYLYREGGWDENPVKIGVDGKERLNLIGTPVIFVPGNAGSFRQVRSLAGTASRIWWELPGVKKKTSTSSKEAGRRSLDFFTIDYNDDFSAFHGQTLLDQSEYLADCIRYILSLYHQEREGPGRSDPTSVIVVAHSMGGIVARAAFLHPNYQAGSISTLITIATPHILPPVTVDSGVGRVYERITDFWRRGYGLPLAGGDDYSENGKKLYAKARDELENTVLISISGGVSDVTIASESVSLASLLPASGSNGFTVFTTSIAGVNTPVDHLAMLWCNQLLQILAESILSIVDVRNPSGVVSRAERIELLSEKLLGGMEMKQKGFEGGRKVELSVLERGVKSAKLALGERLVFRPPSIGIPLAGRHTYILPIPTLKTYGSALVFSLITSSTISRAKDSLVEVYACTSAFECTPLSPSHVSGLPLSPHSSVSPVLPGPIEEGTMGYLSVDVESLSERESILVVIKAGNKRGEWVLAEFGDKQKRVTIVEKTATQLLLSGFKLEAFPPSPMIVSEIWIPALDTSLLKLKLQVFRSSCQESSSLFAPLVRQHSSILSESKYYVNVRQASLYTHASGPFLPTPSSPFASSGARLDFFLDPTCAKDDSTSDLAVEIKIDIWGTLGSMAMRYRMAGLAFPFAIVMLTMGKQLTMYNAGHPFIPFGTAFSLFARSTLLPLLGSLTLLSLLQSIALNSHLSASEGLHASEPGHSFHPSLPPSWIANALLGNKSSFFILCAALLVFAAIGMVVVEYFVLQFIVSGAAKVVTLMQRVGPAQFQAYFPLTEPRETLPTQRVISMGALLLLVLFFAPYQFAFLVIFLVHLFSVIRSLLLAQDATSPSSTLSTKRLWDRYHYSFVILLIMMTLLPMNAMILVVWVRNLAVGWLAPFSSDHNFLNILGFLLNVEALHSGKMLKRSEGSFRKAISTYLPLLAAAYSILYGLRYTHNIYPLTNILFLWLGMNHSDGFVKVVLVGVNKRRSSLINSVKLGGERGSGEMVGKGVGTGTSASNSSGMSRSLSASANGSGASSGSVDGVVVEG